MSILSLRRAGDYALILVGVILTAVSIYGQAKPDQPAQDQAEDVVRVNTSLVQTDVMVFDKKGHFVSGLKPEQFALKIDNKRQAISFFEQVTSRGLREERKTGTTTGELPATVHRGRTVIFFA